MEVHNLPSSLTVTYKYAIQMTHLHKTIREFLHKLSHEHITQLWNGKFLVLVDPIYQYTNFLFVHPTLDIDLPLSQAIDVLRRFYQEKPYRKKFWYVEYTGKNAFHVYFTYLVKIDNKQILQSPSNIRNAILKMIPDWMINSVDKVSSIRDIPILRIGFRTDTNRMALPILTYKQLNIDYINQVSTHRGFDDVFRNEDGLLKYIYTKLIPSNWISLNDYYKIWSL